MCFEHEIPQEQRLQLGRWPLRKHRKGICEELGDWKEISYQVVCVFKREEKKSRGGGERREDFPAEKDKRNLKVIATLSLNL